MSNYIISKEIVTTCHIMRISNPLWTVRSSFTLTKNTIENDHVLYIQYKLLAIVELLISDNDYSAEPVTNSNNISLLLRILPSNRLLI